MAMNEVCALGRSEVVMHVGWIIFCIFLAFVLGFIAAWITRYVMEG